MQFQTINRDTPERMFRHIKNVEGATITTGLPVALVLGASNDGLNAVVANAAGDYPGFIGIALNDIPNNEFGRIQGGGFVNSVLISNVGTSITINVGDPLVPAPGGMFSGAPTYANSGFKWVHVASNVPVAISGPAYVSGIIRMV